MDTTKDKQMSLWATRRTQMDNSVSLDGFSRPDDPFNGLSEGMNLDAYAGWCTSPSAADQMLASFALSNAYASYDYSINGGDFVLPVSSDDENRQKSVQESGNDIIQRSPPTTLAEKMLKVLSLVKDSSGTGILAQIWVPIKEGDKYILSTCEQPYLLDQALAGYREVSRGFTFSAEVRPGNFPGLPGRVFTSKVPEWTSNVAHYNKCEYLRIDHALSHEVRGSIAVPVFEDGSYENGCCAVLELVTMKEKADFSAEMDHICRALETVNLKSVTPPRLHKQCLSKNQMAALSEITDVLRAVCHAHRLPVALTWIPCSFNEQVGNENIKVRVGGRNGNSTEKSILCIQPDACYVNDREMQGFVQACSEHHLEESQGIAGKVLQSNHPFFFHDVKEYHINQYPLVQHARKYGLNAAVAISLRSTYTGDDDYILEFFLPVNMKGSTEQQLLLNNLSGTMQRICRSLRTVSDAEVSGVVGPGVDQVSVNSTEVTDAWTETRAPEQPVNGSKRQSEKKRSSSEINVSLSVLQQYFSGTLKDAAKAIGVCPTTLKRICRQHGISRWPSRKINKVNRSLKRLQTVLDSVQGVEGGLKFDPTTCGLVAASGVTQDPNVQKSSNLSNNTPESTSCFNHENPIVKVEGELKLSNSIPNPNSNGEYWSPVNSQPKVKKSNPCFLSQNLSSMANGDDMDTSMVDDHDHNPSTSSSNGSMMNGSSSSSPSIGGLKTSKRDMLSCDEGSKLTVKATYKEDTVRFKFEPTSGWFQLYEEVAKRFKIQAGTFELKYRDDEEEWVLLVCESDWNECLEILDFLGTRTVKFLVRDAAFATGSSGSSNCFLMGSC
ncbi:protein NLP9-like isoform X1 [Bidens hawaiensis]|uniref:protein NLP9-like isoform X1 n=1 Tax=Bidens hawaiensis TaxID=980011 RepID=UPI00404964E4